MKSIQKKIFYTKGNFNQLLIENIIFLMPNDDIQNLKHVLEAIHLWEFICDGYVGERDINMLIPDESFTLLLVLITLNK